MKRKPLIKLLIDIGMTVILLLLMAFELIGRVDHEWLGMAMLALFIAHHILNRKWSKNITKGQYTPYRVCQTVLVVLVFLTMAGSMVSGIMLSQSVFAFLPIHSGLSFARNLHIISAYWGFVAMSLHLGLHWQIVVGMAGKIFERSSIARKWALRAAAALVAGYGIYAFIKRDIGDYMLLKSTFVFFDFSEPLVLFLLDYLAIMGLFVCAGYYLAQIFRFTGKRRGAL